MTLSEIQDLIEEESVSVRAALFLHVAFSLLARLRAVHPPSVKRFLFSAVQFEIPFRYSPLTI